MDARSSSPQLVHYLRCESDCDEGQPGDHAASHKGVVQTSGRGKTRCTSGARAQGSGVWAAHSPLVDCGVLRYTWSRAVTTGPSTRVEVSVLGRLDMFLTTRERQSCSAGAPTSVWHRLSQRDTHICRVGVSPSSSSPRMRHRQANMERYFSLTACPLPGCCISLLASLLGTLQKRPDTVGEPPSTKIYVSHIPSWKAKKLGKLSQEKVLLEL
jgi:hypothetical protein